MDRCHAVTGRPVSAQMAALVASVLVACWCGARRLAGRREVGVRPCAAGPAAQSRGRRPDRRHSILGGRATADDARTERAGDRGRRRSGQADRTPNRRVAGTGPLGNLTADDGVLKELLENKTIPAVSGAGDAPVLKLGQGWRGWHRPSARYIGPASARHHGAPTMRYLHTMVRVSDLDASLDFYADKLGLKEVRRHESQQGRYTLVFLAADENPERTGRADLQLGSRGLHRRAQFRPSRLFGAGHLRDLPAADGQGRHDQPPPARRPDGLHQVARRHLDRASAAGRGAAGRASRGRRCRTSAAGSLDASRLMGWTGLCTAGGDRVY